MDNNENKPKQSKFILFFKGVLNYLKRFFIELFLGIFDFCKKLVIGLKNFVVNFGIGFVKFFVKMGRGIGNFFKNIYVRFARGGWRTRMSYFVMGSGHVALERPTKGILYFLAQVAYFIFMFVPGGGLHGLGKMRTLGTQAFRYVDECVFPSATPIPVEDCPPGWLTTTKPVYMDNSMLIMLFGVATILVTLFFLVLYFMQIRGVFNSEKKYKEARVEFELQMTEFESSDASFRGEEEVLSSEDKLQFINPLPTFKDELKSLVNERFHFTTLTLPALTISVFTILPLIFMILLAFTNYNKVNTPPTALFSWVGLKTFFNLFSNQGSSSFGNALWEILQWTFIWAIFATVTNYIFGLILAMIINRKSIKLKKFWRTIFVISIAVPQFVTLLLMSQLLKDQGPLNMTLLDLGIIKAPIKFLSEKTLARTTVILVNIWVGVPYTMLITSGILMNIPSDLYESARIDGAGPVRQFTSITLPYMLFVTGPYLITQFIGNINNFNVIFFLTGGGPSAGQFGVAYGHTDILITWLYALTVGGDKEEYAIGSALGIFIFIISITITLVLYSRTSAAQSEGEFA